MSGTLIIKTDKRRSQLPHIVSGLRKRGVVVQVLSSDPDFLSKLKKSVVKKKIKAIPEPKTFGDFFFFTLFFPLITLWGLARLVRYRFASLDKVIFTSLTDKLLLTLPARIIGYRVYWFEPTFYTREFLSNIYILFLRLWSRLATIIATSESVQSHLQKEVGLREKSIMLIQRSLDPDFVSLQSDLFDEMAENSQKRNQALFVVGYIGELKTVNGIEYLIKSLDELKELIPDLQVIIVGDGPEKKNIIWLTKTIGLSNVVRFVGLQDNIHRWYQHFDLLVMPRTERTDFSGVVLEAMSCGVPVVASNVDGVSEIVNQQGGILVPPKDTEKLIESIFALYNDQRLRKTFAKQAAARVHKYFAWDAMLDKYQKLFEEKK